MGQPKRQPEDVDPSRDGSRGSSQGSLVRNQYGCDVWSGRKDKHGYGHRYRGKDSSSLVHVQVWVEANGPVPEGKELDHRCRNRACARLVHLRAVTPTENGWLKKLSTRVKWPLCDLDHDKLYSVITPEGGRVCRLCSK